MNASTRNNIILTLRLTTTALFLFSAVAKLYPIEAFEKQLVDLGFASWTTAPYLSRAIIGFEAFLGLAFLQKNYLRSWIIPLTAGLLVVFCLHLGYTIYTTGNSGNCGCFGQLIKMTPLEALIKNIITLGLLGYLYKLTAHYEKKKILVPSALLAVTYIGLFIAFPVKSYGTHFNEEASVADTVKAALQDTLPSSKPLEDTLITVVKEIIGKEKTTVDTKTTLTPTKKDTVAKTLTTSASAYAPKVSIYAGFKNFSDGVSANVDKGTSVVCMLSLECEHCMETARQIGELSKEQKLPPVYFLFFGSPGELDHFFDVAKCKFPYKIVEPQVFFPLLGDVPSPPRVSVLKEGNIVADFDNDSFSKEKLKKAIE
ncbi:MAG TPA: MauE/DoxX family redox-associated membrane protein [Cytophagaceae bacterium]|jgi:hypothetical protein|nr:MauE/DoxX family redox-associated membrane protein [Cytophagaceae bacterium]